MRMLAMHVEITGLMPGESLRLIRAFPAMRDLDGWVLGNFQGSWLSGAIERLRKYYLKNLAPNGKASLNLVAFLWSDVEDGGKWEVPPPVHTLFYAGSTIVRYSASPAWGAGTHYDDQYRWLCDRRTWPVAPGLRRIVLT